MSTCFCNDTGFIIISRRVWQSNDPSDWKIVSELHRCPNANCTHGFVYKENISEYSIPNEIPEFYKI